MWRERVESAARAGGRDRGRWAAGSSRSMAVLRAARVIALVAAERGVPPVRLLEQQRGMARVAEARQLAMYLMHVVDGCLYAEIGGVFGRDRTTVAHACAAVEERREVLRYDEAVSRLERVLSTTARGTES